MSQPSAPSNVSLFMSDHPHTEIGHIQAYNLEVLPTEITDMINELARRSSLRIPEHQAIITKMMRTLGAYWMPIFQKHAKMWCRDHNIDHSKILNMDGDMVFSYRYPELHKSMVIAAESGVRAHCINVKRLIDLRRNDTSSLEDLFGEPIVSYESKIDITLDLFAMIDVIGR
jgi:hypothetical protein